MTRGEAITGGLLALGAATAYGINAILVKEGIQRFGIVLPGLAVAAVVGLVAMGLVALRSPRPTRPPTSAFGFILLSGLCSSCGISAYFLALSQLPVSVVAPISSAYPLVTLTLAHFFLHDSERITWRSGLGVICVVAGVILITLTRA